MTADLQNLTDRVALLERHVAALLVERDQRPVRPGRTHLTAADIIKVVAEDHGLTQRQLTGRSRQLAISRARFLAIYLIARATDLGRADIMRLFNGRRHEMVGYAMTHVEARRDTEPAFASRLASYLNQFDRER